MLMGMGQSIDLTGAFGFDTTGAPTNIPCMDPTFSGPLQLGQSYCVTSASTPAVSTTATCPSGSTCTIVPGIPNSNIYLAVGAVVSLFLASTIFGGGRR